VPAEQHSSRVGIARRAVGPALVLAAVLAAAAAQAAPIARTTRSGPALADSAGQALPECVVPRLLGRTPAQISYAGTLSGLVTGPPTQHCRLGSVTLRHPVRPARGQPEVVVSQSPRAGTHVPYFSPVSLVLAPARPPVRPGRCHIFAGTDALARSSEVVVYRTYRENDVTTDPTLPPLVVKWRACLRSSGARQTIFAGDVDGDAGYVDAGDFALGGSFVAHTVDRFESKYTGGSDYRSIVVFDLATRRQTLEVAVGSTLGPGNDPPGALPLPSIPAIAVDAAGAVAWVSSYPTGALLSVNDAQGTRVLAAAPVAGIADLAVGPTAVTWVANGMRESAPIS
jgi:hypothetical protein